MKKSEAVSVPTQVTELPPGRRIVHFHYSAAEQTRFASHLEQAIRNRETAVLACPPALRFRMLKALHDLGLEPGGKLAYIELGAETPDRLPEKLERIATALRGTRSARLLADFESLIVPPRISEVEAMLGESLAGIDVRCLTQYDGHDFPAGLIMAQFRTHDWVIVSNAVQNENRNFTPAEADYRRRSIAAKA